MDAFSLPNITLAADSSATIIDIFLISHAFHIHRLETDGPTAASIQTRSRTNLHHLWWGCGCRLIWLATLFLYSILDIQHSKLDTQHSKLDTRYSTISPFP